MCWYLNHNELYGLWSNHNDAWLCPVGQCALSLSVETGLCDELLGLLWWCARVCGDCLCGETRLHSELLVWLCPVGQCALSLCVETGLCDELLGLLWWCARVCGYCLCGETRLHSELLVLSLQLCVAWYD